MPEVRIVTQDQLEQGYMVCSSEPGFIPVIRNCPFVVLRKLTNGNYEVREPGMYSERFGRTGLDDVFQTEDG
jgi:hypothetical protein